MDDELLNEFYTESQKYPSITRLSDSEISEIQDSIQEKFKVDIDRTWCWENIGVIHKTIEYGEEDGLEKIIELLNNNITVKIVVTDENVPPWFGFKGKLFDIIEVLHNLKYFEYFIIDEKCSWIIFDTHHNTLIFTDIVYRLD
ncbi:MAG: hypothetical protein PVF82_20150 [Gammaproteobacteria bacterium]|jgi:hypothetical protein